MAEGKCGVHSVGSAFLVRNALECPRRSLLPPLRRCLGAAALLRMAYLRISIFLSMSCEDDRCSLDGVVAPLPRRKADKAAKMGQSHALGQNRSGLRSYLCGETVATKALVPVSYFLETRGQSWHVPACTGHQRLKHPAEITGAGRASSKNSEANRRQSELTKKRIQRKNRDVSSAADPLKICLELKYRSVRVVALAFKGAVSLPQVRV